jgi:CheY-like chemotaxis protein
MTGPVGDPGMSHDQPLILLADDESHILYVLSLKLREAGCRVITAQNGRQALEMALAQGPDLVITDYQMPYKTGLELCSELLQHEAVSRTPVIILTAREFSLSKGSLSSNVIAVIAKPFSSRDVLTRVQESLGGGYQWNLNDVA